MKVQVTSEIGQLNAVLVHTPGPELLAVTPRTREDFLYDDIIEADTARREHHERSRDLLDTILLDRRHGLGAAGLGVGAAEERRRRHCDRFERQVHVPDGASERFGLLGDRPYAATESFADLHGRTGQRQSR